MKYSLLSTLCFLIAAVLFFLLFKKRGSVRSKYIPTPTLDSFSVDFTAQILSGHIDPIIGREDEINRLTQILSRRSKNNAILVGPAGVGKTAIAEGLAQRIAHNEVPESLQGKRVIALDVTNLFAGTKYRGELEQRAKHLVKEIERAGRSVILFVDEIHTLIQSQGAEGALNISDIFKPALARGDLQMIGATTEKEYAKYFKADSSLERRFQKILIKEPSIKETVKILEGVKDKYIEYHKVAFTDAALKTAATEAKRVSKRRRLPDSAIDAIDEAGAKIKVSHVHEHVPVLLYKAAVQKNPKVAKLWKQIQEHDSRIIAGTTKQTKALQKKREALEDTIRQQGVITVDSDDIISIVKTWHH